MSSERRMAPRDEVMVPARILRDSLAAVPCVIHDRSDFGALLKVDDALGIPDEFEVEIPSTGETMRASVAWRDARSLGVMVE